MALTPDMTIFRHRPYAHYWVMTALASGSRQMQVVVIGAQVYLLALETRTVEQAAFVLGLVGLTQFIPVFLLSLVGGQAADRFSQRGILIACQAIRALVSLVLVASVFMPTAQALPTIFIAAFILGCAAAFSPAASSALYPRLIPRAELPMAVSWNSLGRQTSLVAFPAIGGLIYAVSAEYVFSLAALMYFAATLAIATAGTPRQAKSETAAGLDMVIEGLRYVGKNKIVLGAISLDLVVVFFGSVIALLPVFAFDIPECRQDRARLPAIGLRDRRGRGGLPAGIEAFGKECRALDVWVRRGVRPWHSGVCRVEDLLDLHGRPHHRGRGRYGLDVYPLVADPACHAGRNERSGEFGVLHLYLSVEPTRRF